MRHRRRRGKLPVSSSHRRAMGRNLVSALFQHGRITTTIPKAKAFRPFAERLITLARKGNEAKATGTRAGEAAYVTAMRRAAALLADKQAVQRLFKEVAPAVADRPGGYTRILRLPTRRLGDNTPKALFELVDEKVDLETPDEAQEEAKPKRKGWRKGRKKAAAAE